jgi:hypothetical protein
MGATDPGTSSTLRRRTGYEKLSEGPALLVQPIDFRCRRELWCKARKAHLVVDRGVTSS